MISFRFFLEIGRLFSIIVTDSLSYEVMNDLFMTCMSLYQFFETIMLYGEASFRVYCQGLTIALLPFLYGLLVYIVSVIIRIAQKPRI